MRRRDFIKGIAGSAVVWPLAARAQQPAMPVIGFLDTGASKKDPELMPAFFRGLAANGWIEGRNVTIEYRHSEGDEKVLPAMAEDLVRRNVAVMTTVGGPPATLAAKAATPSIPIAFLVGADPVSLGIVANSSSNFGSVEARTSLPGLQPDRGAVEKRAS